MLDDAVQTKQMTELNLTTSHDVPERPINKGLEACEVYGRNLTYTSHHTSHNCINNSSCEVCVRFFSHTSHAASPLFISVSRG